jgi:geranylgeranyl diphosphate synthase type II
MDAELRASHDALLASAMAYSLDAGGKRLRPLLVLATASAFGAPIETAYPAAAAVEFVHTYSLIHDDLPAMDNADLRRGRATSHVRFDEATAVLAGDALLTDAFRIVSQGALSPQQRLDLVQTLATAAGSPGMVAGQMMDMAGSKRNLSTLELAALHRHKTGALLRAAVAMGAIVAGVSSANRVALDQFASAFGLGFQIKDDIEDVTETAAELGKSNSQDAANAKTTYVSLYGLSGARQKLAEQYHRAQSALAQIDADTTVLAAIADYLA